MSPRARSSRSLSRASVAALLVAAAFSRPSFAQTDEERAGARSAATAGAQAFEEKRWTDAVDLFTRAESLVHSPTHLLYLARGLDKLGKLVKARELFQKITRESLPASAPAAFRAAQAEAQKELDTLEPRIPYVTVNVDGAGAKAITVTQDGVAIPPALVGVPRPVDPGEHEFQASTDTLASQPLKLKVAEAGRETLLLKLEPKVAGAASAPPSGAAAPGAEAAKPGASSVPPGDGGPATAGGGGSSGLKIGGFVALGVGVIGLAGGTIFLLKANSKRSDADALCDLAGGRCRPEKKDEIATLDSDADSASTLSTLGFVVGGVGVAAGITLLVLSGKSGEKAASHQPVGPQLRPFFGVNSVGVFGTF